nr:MAG TPA: hypothetical protein [Caudoviricetes sp.]
MPLITSLLLLISCFYVFVIPSLTIFLFRVSLCRSR